MEEKTEGILLQAIPYLGNQKILKIFTPEGGLISLFAKKAALSAIANPFLVAEWVYRCGKEEMHLLKDATLLNGLERLRQSYSTITAAGQIAQDLLRSQLPAKKGKDLYALTLAYFEQLPFFERPETLVSSFRLKLLIHEGLLTIQSQCARCDRSANKISEGESVCSAHTMGYSFSYTSEEWETLVGCATARKFAALQSLVLPPQLEEKIRRLLEERTR